MTLQNAFWVLMLLWLVFGFVVNWPSFATGQWQPFGSTLLLFLLLLLLGWGVFGAPIK